MNGRLWEIMGDYGRLWEIMGDYGRLDGICPGNNVECWWHLVLRPYLSTLGSRN